MGVQAILIGKHSESNFSFLRAISNTIFLSDKVREIKNR